MPRLAQAPDLPANSVLKYASSSLSPESRDLDNLRPGV